MQDVSNRKHLTGEGGEGKRTRKRTEKPGNNSEKNQRRPILSKEVCLLHEELPWLRRQLVSGEKNRSGPDEKGSPPKRGDV